MLTGRLANLRKPPIAASSQLNPELTDDWDELLYKSIHTSARKRFQFAEEMRYSLEKLYTDWTSQAVKNSPAPTETHSPNSADKQKRKLSVLF